MSNGVMVVWGGWVLGLLFGAVGQRTGFCLMRGLRDAWLNADGRMLRSFCLAVAVAIVGTHVLMVKGWVDLGQSVHLQPGISWGALLLGGFLFGQGMVLANGCGARALVLLATGNLRSLLVLLTLGVGAGMILTGVFAEARLFLMAETRVAPPWGAPALDGLAMHWLGNAVWVGWLPALLIPVLLLVYCFSSRRFAGSARHWLAGLAVGMLVVAGWWVTGHLGADPFEPVPLTSFSFVAPVGDSVLYLMLATGVSLEFGVALVAGVVLGSLVSALLGRQFWLQGFSSPGEMLRYLLGGLLMGIGGGLGLGCSIGQGITGLSTLSLGSVIAVAGILLGARTGLWWTRAKRA